MIDTIINLLRQYKASSVFNPWTDRDQMDTDPYRAPDQRLERLASHFNVTPKFLLIGEAPGYQGCKFSGVPFTNEALLSEGKIPRLESVGRFTTRPLPWREPSATIVWRELYKHRIEDYTVMWNAFAFHPHHRGMPYSNRAPSRQEVRSCVHVLNAVLEHCAGAKVIAVGRMAATALRLIGVHNIETIRHPSMGGATLFGDQLTEILNRT